MSGPLDLQAVLPHPDDRRWHKREALVRRIANDTGEPLNIRAEWRCYPLGWNVGIVCSVDPVTFEWWVRWRNSFEFAERYKGKAANLAAAQLDACERAELMVADALTELAKQNLARRKGEAP